MRSWPLLVSVFTPACLFFKDEAKPAADFAVAFATQYNHRGMPMNKRGVAQPEMGVALPTKDGGNAEVRAWGNIDLNDDVGDAWFPSGHDGRFSQVEFTGTWSHTWDQSTLALGLQHYIPPFAAFFPFGPRGSTTEAFVRGSTEFLGAAPFLEIRYDYDQVDGFYFRGGSSESIPIAEGWSLELAAHLGYSSSAQSFWNYALRVPGWADLQASAAVAYALDPHTTISLTLAGVTMVDDDFRNHFDASNLAKTNYWAALAFAWRY
jgi:hypothetical protein